jgi:integrase
MGVRSKGFRKDLRGDKSHWIIDFYYLDTTGRRQRYKRRALAQTASAAAGEAKRLMAFAAEHGFVERDDDEADDTKAVTPTLRAFVETTFETEFLPNYRPATIQRYRALFRQGLLATLGNVRLDEFSAAEYRSFATVLLKREVQLKGPLNLVKTVLRAAKSAGVIERLPELPSLVKPSKKLPRAPSCEEVAAIIDASPPWLKVALGLAAYAGLRSGEIRALEVRDVELERRRIHVRRALSENIVCTTKSDAERFAPLPEPLAALLPEVVRLKLPKARVVILPSGKELTRQRLLSEIRRVQAHAKLELWNVHSFRHFFCSELARQKVSLETVRVLAGHTNLSTTARYLHADDDDLRAAADVFNKKK